MLSFSEKLGHPQRTSASRYFWWLAFEHTPGLWGCISGVIGAILGIAAGKSSDYSTFRSLYIAQSVFVSDDLISIVSHI